LNNLNYNIKLCRRRITLETVQTENSLLQRKYSQIWIGDGFDHPSPRGYANDISTVHRRCVCTQYLLTYSLSWSSGCEQVTCISLTPEANMAAVAYGHQLCLRYVDMSDCCRLDDSGLQLVVTYCPAIVQLYVRRCPLVTDVGQSLILLVRCIVSKCQTPSKTQTNKQTDVSL